MQYVPFSSYHVIKVSSDVWRDTHDELALEEPLEIQLEYGKAQTRTVKSFSVTMRTPGNDPELAIGFLYTEGIIQSNSDVQKLVTIDANVVRIVLSELIVPDLQKLERHFYTSSSCGLCGKSSIDAIHTITTSKNAGNPELSVSTSLICSLPQLLEEKQKVFNLTGGIHASALFRKNGELILLKEDVGRHNALDKLIGAAFLENQLPLSEHILLLSGRASFELMQKAIMGGIPVVCAVGAPSGLAVQMAMEHNITLVGFLRDERFNIYAGKERIAKAGVTSDELNRNS
jgi:FdhD protein